MVPDTITPSEPREAVTAYCEALRTHFGAYRRIFRELGDAEAVPASSAVDAASGERLRALVVANAPAAERQVGMLLGCRLHLADIVARYGKGFRVGVADAPRLAKELDTELARLDTLQSEVLAALTTR